MSEHHFDPESVDQLPQQLPVFPLPGATLLPGTQLPLNIFEPRYLNMVSDALAGARMIGMVQPQEVPSAAASTDLGLAQPEPSLAQPELYGVGCAGRIVSFAESADGRYLITLRGVCRYRIEAELDVQRGYRRVQAGWAEFTSDFERAAIAKLSIDDVRDTLQGYLRERELRVDWDGLAQVPTATGLDFLAMNLPFAVHEKQALLEAVDSEARWQVMLAIAHMGTSSSPNDSGETRH